MSGGSVFLEVEPMNGLRSAGAWLLLGFACLAVLVAPGPGGGAALARPSHGSSTHVYVLRGFINLFSPGMNTLAAEIKAKGIPTSVHDYSEWLSLADTAIEKYRKGGEKTIIVIGHSFGAVAAASMASRIGDAGVPVKLLVTFDPVVKPTISANVARAYNFYVSNGIGYAAQRAANYRGPLSNVDRRDLNHVSIATAPDLHRKVLGYVLSAVGSRPSREAAPAGNGHHSGNSRSTATAARHGTGTVR
jgi:pimeloyl-ACP methyl ester carboxylesterase